MRSRSSDYSLTTPSDALLKSVPQANLSDHRWRRLLKLISPVFWIGLLGSISMFGMLQRPPLMPLNMTYLLFGIVLTTFIGTVVIRRRDLRLRWARSDVFVAVLIGTGVFSSLVAGWFFELPIKIAEGERITYFGMLLLYFITRLVVVQRQQIYLVIGILVAGMAIQSLIGVALYFVAPSLPALTMLQSEDGEDDVEVVDTNSFSGAGRLSGFSGNPNMFVTLPLMALPLAIGLLLTATNARYRAWLTLTTGLAAMGVLLAFSRSAWIGIFIGMASLLRLWPILPRLKGTRIIVLVGVALAAVGGVALLKSSDAIASRYDSIEDRHSLGGRPEMWQHAFDLVMTYPTGVGLGNYKDVNKRLFNDNVSGHSAHNSIIGITADGGILAGLAMLFFLWDRFGIGVRANRGSSLHDRALLIGLSAAFLALAVHLCFHSVHGQIYIWVLAACQSNLRQLPSES